MRTLLAFFAVGLAGCGQPLITPAEPPVVRQGATFQFTGNCPSGNCTWSMAPGSAGAIDPATGLYTAPASVDAHNKIAGCQLFANNHIYNVRVDRLPLHPASDRWQAAVVTNASPAARMRFASPNWGHPFNVVDENTPPIEVRSLRTRLWDGPYRISTPRTWMWGDRSTPTSRIQAGWFAGPGVDRHWMSIDKDCTRAQELYGLFDPSVPVTIDGRSYTGYISSSAVWYKPLSFEIPLSKDRNAKELGSAAAFGGYILGVEFDAAELKRAAQKGTPIKHAIAMTLPNGALATHATPPIWPGGMRAWSGACKGGLENCPTYGARGRLKASFNPDVSQVSKDPAVRAYVQTLIDTMKTYGFFIMDGTMAFDAFAMPVRGTVGVADHKVSTALDLFRYHPVLADTRNQLEWVDQSVLMHDPNSGVVRNTDYGAEAEVVILRDNQSGKQDVRDIILQGATVGFHEYRRVIQAGAAPIELRAYVNGVATPELRWTATPDGVGNLDSQTGVYTPPASLKEPVLLTVRATSIHDPEAYGEQLVSVLPDGPLYLKSGGGNQKDALGRTWWGYDRSGQELGAVGFTPTILNAKTHPEGIPTGAFMHGAIEETTHILHLPNGRYHLTVLGNTGCCPSAGAKRSLEIQDLDPIQYEAHQLGGGTPWTGFTFPIPEIIEVKDGKLVIASRFLVSSLGSGYTTGLLIEPAGEGSTRGAPRRSSQ